MNVIGFYSNGKPYIYREPIPTSDTPKLLNDIVQDDDGRCWRLITNQNGQRLRGVDVTAEVANASGAEILEWADVMPEERGL